MKHLIVDVDVGTDDYLAILILLKAEKLGKLKIDAIICSNGNTSVKNVCKNVARLLYLENRTDIPVFKGVESTLILHQKEIPFFHLEDGFGNLQLNEELDLSFISDKPACIAINEIISKNPNEISYMCLGPLTNLALAFKIYPNLTSDIKDLWIMGGNHTAVGNVTSSAEFNFYMDPEAVYMVLECGLCPIFILPWEACLIPKISFDWRYNTLGDCTPSLELLGKADRKVYTPEWDNWMPCDAFVAYVYLDLERHAVKQSVHHATVELHSSFTRGQVVLDHMKNHKPNVTIIEQFHEENFKSLLLTMFKE